MERHGGEDAFSLLQHDHYTIDDLARITLIDRELIEHAAFAGELKATIVDHHVVRIDRRDAVAWLKRRGLGG